MAGDNPVQHTNTLCNTLMIPSHWIEVDIERLLFSLAVKMPHFWSPEMRVINSPTKCLISVKIAILTPHIISPTLVNVWLILDLQKYVNWFCMFLEVNPSMLSVSKSTRLLYGQGCQKFRAQVAANFTKSRGRQCKSSQIFPIELKLKMHPKCLNLGALCVKLTKNHPNGRKNNRLSNFRKLRIITFEAFRWLYMTS